MFNTIEKSICKNAVFYKSIDEISPLDDLSSQKLCIIKTDFKDLSPLTSISAKYPDLDIWLTSTKITRDDIFMANDYGIKNVLLYPFDMKPIDEYFKNKNKKREKPAETEIPSWIKGMKVMVVDDNEMNVALLVETLASTGLEVTTFTNPFDAADAANKERFDLFLLDVMMPDMSGFDLGRIIKKSVPNSNSLMMFISALSDSENKITGYNLGSCAYIEKPFDINVVRSQIINTLKSKQLNDAINDTKESFFAMVAHDLKSPVNSEIVALKQILKNYENNNKEKDSTTEIVTDILGAVKFMKNLVENVVDKYRYDNGCNRLNKENKSIKLLVEESLEETKYLISDKKLSVELSYRAKTENILMDFLEVKRVVHNLLINAVENTPKASVIEIDISENKKYIVFSIRNPSNGIPIPNPEEIFDKFISRANKNKKISSGLGLYIAKQIVNAHGGSIHIDVKNPDFVRFVFTLPK